MSNWWTEEETEALEVLLDAGHDVATISTVLLSRSKDSIRDKIKSIGRDLPRKQPRIDTDKLNFLVRI